MEDLALTLEEMAADMASRGEPPLGIVAIDTVAASTPGANENDSADMSDVIYRVQRLSQRLNLLVLMVAHHGKDETRGIRGWSGQTGAADLILTCQRDAEDKDLRILTTEKVKDGEDGDRFAFRLAGVTLGDDDDGDPITSATPAFEPAPATRRGPKALNTAEALALKAVTLVTDHGPCHPAPAMPGVPRSLTVLARSDVKARAMSCGFSAPEEKANTVSARFSRALQGLAAKGRVRLEGDWVWLV